MKVRAGLLMAEIAKKQGIKIGDPELEEGLKELAEQTGKNLAKLRAEYRDAKKREMLIGMILENKVLDIIESKAKIAEARESDVGDQDHEQRPETRATRSSCSSALTRDTLEPRAPGPSRRSRPPVTSSTRTWSRRRTAASAPGTSSAGC